MKIVYLIDVLPENGGAPISTKLIANNICSNNDVTIVMPSGTYSSTGYNSMISFYQLPGINNISPSIFQNRIKLLTFAKEVKKAIKLLKPDIVHIQTPPSGWMVGLLLLFGQLPGSIKYIYHDRALVTQSHWFVRLISKFFIKKRIKNIVCLTDGGLDFWKSKKNKVFLIPNAAGGVFDNYEPSRKKTDEIVSVSFVGRYTDEKDWPLTEKVICELSHDNITINIVVQFTTEAQKKDYLLMKDRLSVYSNISFYENISQEQLSDIYYDTDIFVMTSKKESFGRTAVEAMSRKCVVIGTNIGGIPYVIGKTDNIVPRDEKNIYSRIAFYISNKNALEEDKELFFNRYYELFSTIQYKNKHIKMYGELA